MTTLYLLEPPPSVGWFPFADCRPICELRAGVWRVRERWEAAVDAECAGIFGPEHLHDFAEDEVPRVSSREVVTGPAVIGRSDFAPAGTPVEPREDAARLVNDGETVGWWVPEGITWQGTEAELADEIEVEGMILLGAFDLVTALEHFLPADAADFTHERADPIPDGVTIIGDPGDVVILGAAIEPGVLVDVREGPVILEQGAYVRSRARLEGPLYVGPRCEVAGGDIKRSVLGPRCKVRGELETTVFVGYANKAHDGFVGHSVIGRWVNLGADTITSNLKNTYGPIALKVGDETVTTGRQNLGAMIGDHVKVAIGTLFGTGSAVGVGANVFGTVRPPPYVPPFAWGDTGASVHLEGFLTVAARVLPRRDVPFDDAVRATLERIHRHVIPE